MRPDTRGVIVAELLVVVALIAVAALAIHSCVGGSGLASDEAREFAQQMGLELQGVACQQYDSNNDGYVSCTLRVHENGAPRLLPVECAARMSFNRGCRLPARMMVQP